VSEADIGVDRDQTQLAMRVQARLLSNMLGLTAETSFVQRDAAGAD